jgi:predicted deacylase
MPETSSKKTIWVIVFIVVLLALSLIIWKVSSKPVPVPAPVEVVKKSEVTKSIIGQSVEKRDIEAYTYGTGPKHLLFVGGIHCGYEWNSVLLAYTFIDYLTAHPDFVPAGLTITIIPSANPDGVFEVTGKEGRFNSSDISIDAKILAAGRFNANKVDLNRNFDCKWQPKSTWQSKTVSAGTAAFSEPETQALRHYIATFKPAAAIFWHSQSNAVYASQCQDGILPGTLDLMNTYSAAAGYPAVKTFDAYVTTGAADDWLASENIPAITVELKTHNTIEWDNNLKGIRAMVGYFENLLD